MTAIITPISIKNANNEPNNTILPSFVSISHFFCADCLAVFVDLSILDSSPLLSGLDFVCGLVCFVGFSVVCLGGALEGFPVDCLGGNFEDFLVVGLGDVFSVVGTVVGSVCVVVVVVVVDAVVVVVAAGETALVVTVLSTNGVVVNCVDIEPDVVFVNKILELAALLLLGNTKVEVGSTSNAMLLVK